MKTDCDCSLAELIVGCLLWMISSTGKCTRCTEDDALSCVFNGVTIK